MFVILPASMVSIRKTNTASGAIAVQVVRYRDPYRNLWHVEQAFRMAKGDLDVLPIFHHTGEAIRAHLLICFLSLALGKYMENATGSSLRTIMDHLRGVGEARLIDEASGEECMVPAAMQEETRVLLRRLGASD